MLATNEILQGRYIIITQMGQNGTGPVYEAYDEALKADVVLREIPVKLNKVTTPAQMESLKTAFDEEAKLLSSVTHESFIRVRDHFSEIGRHYLVMETVDGEYLSDLLEKRGSAFSVPDAADWADQILDGLNYLHTKTPAVIHGDIKPQNIKLTTEGKIKLFALAIARNSESATSSGIAEQTFDATALHYLPLEQIWGNLDLASQKVIANTYDEASEELLMQPPDARSDIYAFGATLYHLLTGQRPIDALERSIDILEGKSDPLPTATKLNPQVPPEISYVMMKAMEIKREKRFESVLIMRQVLKTAALRAKERGAQEVKKQSVIPAPEIRLPEPKTLKIDQPPTVQEAETETDPQRQLELIKARLLEAENKRLAAEQRAAEAERRLLEKEISTSKAPEEFPLLDIPEAPPQAGVLKAVPEDLTQVLEISDRPPAASRSSAAVKRPANDFEFSFSEQPKAKRSNWGVLAIAAVLLVAIGGGFGIWAFMSSGISSGAAKPEQSIPTPVMSLSEPTKSEPSPENAAATTETAPLTNTETNTMTDPASAAANPPAIKAKTAPTPARQTAIAAKTPAKQKKAVTVDDLINDN